MNSIFGFIVFVHLSRSDKFSDNDINLILNDCKLQIRNYEEDLKKNDSEETDMKENCVFHAINNLHVTDNKFVDVMHDVLEVTLIWLL